MLNKNILIYPLLIVSIVSNIFGTYSNLEDYPNMSYGEAFIEVGGITYIVKSRKYTSEDKFSDEVVNTPWYGDQDIAYQFAIAAGGGISGFTNPAPGQYGPFFIYDLDISNMSFVSHHTGLESNGYDNTRDVSLTRNVWNQRYVAYVVEIDTDSDGVGDSDDAFPSDATETVDTDSDGTGNNADTDDDGDGLSDSDEATIGTNPLLADTDGDGLSDSDEATIGTNPLLADTDSDGVGDNADSFPSDPTETTDTDGDGVGDNSDLMPLVDDSTLQSFLTENGYVKMSDISDLRAGSVMIEVIDGTATLSLDIEKSSDLSNWTFDRTATVDIPIEDGVGTQFFRFKMADPDTTVTVTVGEDTIAGRPIGVFYFNGAEKAVLEFEKNTTYTFVQNDSSNATYGSIHHPLMFSTGDDGEHNANGHYMSGVVYKLDGVTKTMAEYVSGFVAASDRRIEWTVPSDAPSTLHYWCHFHTGQGAAMTVTD